MFLRTSALFRNVIQEKNIKTFMSKLSNLHKIPNKTFKYNISSYHCQLYNINKSHFSTTKDNNEEIKKENNQKKEKTENSSSKKTDEKEKSSSSSSDDEISIEKYNELKKDYLEIGAKTELYKKKFEEARKAYIENKEETENMRKRLEKENHQIKDYAITKFAKDLLDVSDNFDRALSSIKDKDFDKLTPEEKINLFKNFVEGVAMTQNVLSNTLKKHGVSEYSPLNEKFDPNIHDAVFDYHDEEKVRII